LFSLSKSTKTNAKWLFAFIVNRQSSLIVIIGILDREYRSGRSPEIENVDFFSCRAGGSNEGQQRESNFHSCAFQHFYACAKNMSDTFNGAHAGADQNTLTSVAEYGM